MQGHLLLQSSVQPFDIAFAINPFMTETDICGANQWTGFYMISASVMKGLKNLVFVVHFLNAFWHGNETFSKGSS